MNNTKRAPSTRRQEDDAVRQVVNTWDYEGAEVMVQRVMGGHNDGV